MLRVERSSTVRIANTSGKRIGRDLMSIIIAAGNKDCIYMATDSRCVWRHVNGDTIIQEDYQKLKQISQDSYIAFAGSVQHCKPIVDYLIQYAQQKQLVGVENYTDFCATAARNMMKIDPQTNVQMIIAGTKQDGTLCIGELTYFEEHGELRLTDCIDDSTYYTVRSCLDPKETFINDIMNASALPIERRLQMCVESAALKSEQINAVVQSIVIRA